MTSAEALDALELDGEITPAAIKRQYRKLSLLHHPDRFRDPAEKKKAHGDFLRIKAAYDFLKDNPPRAGRADAARPAGWGEPRRAPERWHTAPGDDLREWKRQFEKERKEEERKERERERERGGERASDDFWPWLIREWRKLVRLHLFVGAVALLGAAFEPEHAGLFVLAWFLIALVSLAGRFGG